jgi:hypothetical protein
MGIGVMAVLNGVMEAKPSLDAFWSQGELTLSEKV